MPNVPIPRVTRRSVGLIALVALLATITAASPGPAADAQTNGPSIELIHAVPRGATPTPGIGQSAPASMAAVQDFLMADVGRTLRVREGIRQLRIDNGSAVSIRDQLVDAGLDDPATIYLVFADTVANREACGTTLYDSTKPTFAFLLMPVCDIFPIANPQFPAGATYLVLHELLHALGAVPACAPNHLAGGHVSGSNRDILFSGGARDWDNLTIDPGNDDYYGHSIPGCPDLEDSPYWTAAATQMAPCDPALVTIDMNTNGGNGTGTPGNDVIQGTPGPDIINGLGGDDVICAGGGDDEVQGGPGADLILGQAGNDRLFGAQGDDEIRGGTGNDTMHGNRGRDELLGQDGNDRIFGYADADLILGGAGDDRLHGNFGNDEIHGQDGNDRVFGYGDNDQLTGGPGNDLLGGNFGDDLIDGDDGRDRIYGSDGADTVRGGNGADIVDGNSGNDLVQGNAGNDALDGGIGFDSCNGGSGTDTAGRCETLAAIP